MSTVSETSDTQLLDLLRRSQGMSISALAEETGVTATAVRQRLNRLMAQGLVEREVARTGRGRPSHRYVATDKARRRAGSNFADLAITLWQELRAIRDPEIRRGMLQRIAGALARNYGEAMVGTSREERLAGVEKLFGERGIGVEVRSGGPPGLTILDCPYPGLAEQDRGICALEKMLFSELLAEDVRLTQCRLEGHACCQFEAG